jgi:carbonic anhydrase/acetyltransferase-like protein (isoleucine patch superfamily)
MTSVRNEQGVRHATRSDAGFHRGTLATGRPPATAYNSAMPLRPYRDIFPTLDARAYVDPAATVIGDVVLGEDVSIWPGTVVRGDVNFIRVGARTNIQDGSVVHVSHDGPHAKLGGFATVIGADVTIGHKAIVHACRIEDAVLIGMGAVVLDGAVVRRHGFVGAGALVAPGKEVGEGELWLGNPARKVRMLSDAEIEALYYSAAHYVRLKDEYLAGGAA